MRTTKKIVATLAVAVIASLGAVAPSQAAPAHTSSSVGGGWCC
jgi:hypothetical protein